MPRRLALAFLAFLLALGSAQAQVPFGKDAIPGRRALARINLDLQFTTVAPLVGAEKLIQLSIDEGMLFGQTNHANFFAFDAESGRFLWSAHLGTVTTKARPVSVNSYAVYVSNSNSIFALDRKSGRRIWEQSLTDIPSSATAADDNVVVVGLESGKVETFEARTGKVRFNIQTNARVSSHPIVAGKVIVFGSEDKKLYLTKVETPQLLWRFACGGAIVAPLATSGVRTLFVPSSDRALYSIDLFTGIENWTYATGSPVEQEPLVSDNDVYVINDEGFLTDVDLQTGKPKWTISTLGGRLISVTGTKVYLESHDDDLFVVDRATGKVVYDPTTTFKRSGINLREYALGPTNRFDDRLYFGTTHGLIICLREIALVKPRPIRDPNAKPFGYVPPEGYPELAPPPPVVPIGAEGAAATPPTDPK